MGFTKDLWHTTKKDAEGNKTKVRTNRYGSGKRWLAVWHDPNGRERTKAFDRQVDADRHWAAQETDVGRGEYIDPNAGKVLLGDLGKRWLRSRSVDPSSAIQYESKWRLHVEPAFGTRQVKSIKPSEIAEWLTGRNDRYGASTARAAFLVLQGVLELAVADESLKKNPARSKVIQRPSTARGNVVAWADETVARIIDGHPPQFRPIPVVGAGSGLRQGEIFGLAEDDIDYDEQVIHVRRQVKKLGSSFVFALPKNDRERTVPLPDWLAQTIRVHSAAHKPRPYSLPWEKPDGRPVTVNLLFRWTDDKHIRARGYDELVWKPALATAGVIPPPKKDGRGRRRFVTDRTTGMHALRHYYASVTLADGVNIKELAEYLGHADPGFTLRLYAHMLPSSHERARKAIDARMFKPRAVADGTATEQPRPRGPGRDR
jgi:integrase